MQLLHLDSSPRNDRSHTRRLTARFVSQWLEKRPEDLVVYHDLRVFTPPHVNEDWIAAAFARPDERTPQMRQALETSDRLIEELRASDVYVFGVPMYNFGMPSVFKAYVDNVIRIGETFQFDATDEENPYKPLLHDKKMYVAVASGDDGYAPGGALYGWNHLEPHMRTAFNFIGVSDITFFYVGNDEFGGERLGESVQAAIEAIDAAAPC